MRAVSNVHILNQNMEHLNDVVRIPSSISILDEKLTHNLYPFNSIVTVAMQGQEAVNISTVWVAFLRQLTAANDKAR
ncbi:hypothetical protein BBJ28_00021454 [Nothophytophthora sp. Chile5]|nr:hypothetical protein BBJ28_00021454 [Nothophytophthora sp. Chile5]